MKGVNSRALLGAYSGLFVKFTGEELQQMYSRKKKLMTMLKFLDPSDYVDKQYVPKRGRRGHVNIQYWVDLSIQRLPKKHRVRLITTTRNNAHKQKKNPENINGKTNHSTDFSKDKQAISNMRKLENG